MSFKKGDKVLHEASGERMIGTIQSVGENDAIVSFFVTGRKKGGYHIDVDLPITELTHSYVVLETEKFEERTGVS